MKNLKIGSSVLSVESGQAGLSAHVNLKDISFDLSGRWYNKK
jgi:hypothetical protein